MGLRGGGAVVVRGSWEPVVVERKTVMGSRVKRVREWG